MHSDLKLEALFDSGSELNAMHLNVAQKLDLQIKKFNLGAQKIDWSYLDIFGMWLIDFQPKISLKESACLKKHFC